MAHNFNHLYYFYLTAKLGTMTEAAKQLHTSQSSLSQQLKTLEAQLGHTLFERVGRRLQLTQEGHSVYSFCKRAFEITDEISKHLEQMGKMRGPRLSIGVGDEIDRRYTTELLHRVLSVWPDDERPAVRLSSGTQEDLVHSFQSNDLDYLFTAQPVHGEEVTLVTEIQIPIVLVCAPRVRRLAGQGATAVEILRSSKLGLVLPAVELNLRHQIDGYLQKHKIFKNVLFESNISTSLTRSILDGLGMGFVPEPYVEQELKRKSILALSKKPLWNQKFVLYAKKKDAGSVFAQRFADQLKRALD